MRSDNGGHYLDFASSARNSKSISAASEGCFDKLMEEKAKM